MKADQPPNVGRVGLFLWTDERTHDMTVSAGGALLPNKPLTLGATLTIEGADNDLAVDGDLTVTGTTVLTGATTITGALTQTGAIAGAAAVTSSSATAGMGYALGAGGIVTQITSTVTAVVLNTVTGAITTFTQTLAAGVDVSFTLTNSAIAAGDLIIIHTKTYGGTADGIPIPKIQSVAAGSCVINLHNQGAVALDAPVVLSFAIIKGQIA